MALSSVLTSPTPEIIRPKPRFSPSKWGDRFSSFSIDAQVWEKYSKEIDVLKEKVRIMLTADNVHLLEKLNLINTVERLGLSYHFHQQIEDQLEALYNAYANSDDRKDYDLFNTSLSFRLFRQHGYKIGCNVFNKFKASDGKFDESLTDDGWGMLSFYEATYLRIHGEEILDEALDFTTSHLKIMANDLNPRLVKQVHHALEQPLHKGIARLESRHFISFYEEDPSKNELLLRFAKVDFNLVQMLHKQELCHLSRWWNDLDVTSRLPYARNRLVEAYFWAVAIHYEPAYIFSRRTFAKMVAMLALTDDTYDSYATIEEIDLYSDAIQRWDISIIDELPDYMKICYRALLDLFDEFDEEMSKRGRSYSVPFLKEAFQQTVEGYRLEAKWFNTKYMPAFNEYLVNALTSTGLCMLGIALIMGSSDDCSLEEIEYTSHKPKFVLATCLFGRLVDDIVDHEDHEQQELTGVDYYMKEHGVSKEETLDEFRKKIEGTWCDINETILRPTPISMPLLVIFRNLMRKMYVTYKHEDGYTHPEKHMKNYILALFSDDIPI